MLKRAKNGVQISHLNMTWKALTVVGYEAVTVAVMTILVSAPTGRDFLPGVAVNASLDLATLLRQLQQRSRQSQRISPTD